MMSEDWVSVHARLVQMFAHVMAVFLQGVIMASVSTNLVAIGMSSNSDGSSWSRIECSSIWIQLPLDLMRSILLQRCE